MAPNIGSLVSKKVDSVRHPAHFQRFLERLDDGGYRLDDA
jgi:hypothetical protein